MKWKADRAPQGYARVCKAVGRHWPSSRAANAYRRAEIASEVVGAWRAAGWLVRAEDAKGPHIWQPASGMTWADLWQFLVAVETSLRLSKAPGTSYGLSWGELVRIALGLSLHLPGGSS